MGILNRNELFRLNNVIEKAGLPTTLPGLELKKLLQIMEHDKKVRKGKIRFVLLKSIGTAFITDEVSPNLIEQALVG